MYILLHDNILTITRIKTFTNCFIHILPGYFLKNNIFNIQNNTSLNHIQYVHGLHPVYLTTEADENETAKTVRRIFLTDEICLKTWQANGKHYYTLGSAMEIFPTALLRKRIVYLIAREQNQTIKRPEFNEVLDNAYYHHPC